MYIYLMMICIIAISGIIFFKSTKSNKLMFLILVTLILFGVMGFRDISVGTDTRLYCSLYEADSAKSFLEIIQSDGKYLLYSLYSKVVSLFSSDPLLIIKANSFVICILLLIFVYRNSQTKLTTIMLFITFYHFFSAMNIARQYIAVLLVANAIYYLISENKSIIKYSLICICATLIHSTAIISFLLIPFWMIRKSDKKIKLYIFIIFLACILYPNIMKLFAEVFPHYSMYFGNEMLEEVGQNRKIIITIIYMFFWFVMLYILKYKKLDDNKKERFKLYFFINSIAIILGIISLKVMLLSRIEIYYSIFAIIYIPEILDYFREKNFYKFGFVIIMFIPMIIQLIGNNSDVLPYIVSLK